MISVVMSTFNKSEYLKRTLQSIVDQECSLPYEIIVVDDGSTDDTPNVCRYFSVKYYYLDRPNYLNPGPARNVGYRLAQGDIIINQSDDVEYRSPNVIERLVEQLSPTNCVFARVYNVSSEGKRLATYCAPHYRRPLFFLGSVWKKHLFAIGGNDEDFVEPGYEDRWLALCLSHLGIEFLYSSDIIGWHYDHTRLTDTTYSASKIVYRHKLREATNGKHPWTSKKGSWNDTK